MIREGIQRVNLNEEFQYELNTAVLGLALLEEMDTGANINEGVNDILAKFDKNGEELLKIEADIYCEQPDSKINLNFNTSICFRFYKTDVEIMGISIFEIDKSDKIGIKFKATQITGAIVGTSGLLITALGTFLIIEAQDSEGLGTGEAIVKLLFLTAFGIIIDAVGIAATVTGASIFFIGKKYKKDKGWNYKAVQIN